MNDVIVSVKEAYFSYPSRKDVPSFGLEMPNFTIQSGEQLMLMGPSGSGKSTLLNIVAGELVPQRGEVLVLGERIDQLSESERQAFRIANVGFVFQDFPLVPYLDSIQNVLFPYRINPHLKLTATVYDRARLLLDNVGLSTKSGRYPSELSQGERQRVAIARALIANPRLILADEPTAGLDIKRSHEIVALLQEIAINQGIGLLVVSHEPQIVDRFQDVLRLDEQLGERA